MKAILCAFIAGTLTFGLCAGDNLLKSEDISEANGWDHLISKEMVVAGSEIEMGSGAAVCRIGTLDKQRPEFMQLRKPIELEKDKNYRLSFKVKSDKAGKLTIAYLQRNPPWTWYAGMSVNVEVGEKTYSCPFTPKADKDGVYNGPRLIDFLVGRMDGTELTISNVSIEEVK